MEAESRAYLGTLSIKFSSLLLIMVKQLHLILVSNLYKHCFFLSYFLFELPSYIATY